MSPLGRSKRSAGVSGRWPAGPACRVTTEKSSDPSELKISLVSRPKSDSFSTMFFSSYDRAAFDRPVVDEIAAPYRQVSIPNCEDVRCYSHQEKKMLVNCIVNCQVALLS